MTSIANSVVWQSTQISRAQRNRLNNHKSCVLWFTGLPGSGKSTLSIGLEKVLFEHSIRSYVLDGDNLRHTLNKNLGFSLQDRYESTRRVGEVAKILVDAGLFVLVSLISPYEAARNAVRCLFDEGDFIEIYVKCSLQACEHRDPKGLYKKAREGVITNFTGISDPYEVPTNPEIIVDTETQTVEESIGQIMGFLKENEYI